MDKPFAITLDPGSSRANHTGTWRTERPVYQSLLPPCNNACPAGENIQQWLYDAEEGGLPAYEAAWRQIMADNPFPAIMGSGRSLRFLAGARTPPRREPGLPARPPGPRRIGEPEVRQPGSFGCRRIFPEQLSCLSAGHCYLGEV